MASVTGWNFPEVQTPAFPNERKLEHSSAEDACFPWILHFPDNSPAVPRHAFAMKLTCLLLFLTATVAAAFAADPLTESFQRGILAEESRRDLGTAAAAYAEVIRLADAQRELVATALFRLAEVRRRLGQTNEAGADYRRLLREYPEQTNLVSLAQVWVPPRGVPSLGLAAFTDRLARAQMELDARVREHAELAAFMERVEKLPDAEIAQALELRQPTAELTRLRSERNIAEQALTRLREDFVLDHPDVKRARAVFVTIGEQLQREVSGIWVSLAAQRNLLRQEIEERERNLQAMVDRLAHVPGAGLADLNLNPPAAAAPEMDEESREIERLRRVLVNSPDLLNAPQGEAKETPLQTAARQDQARVVEFLLAQKADFNLPAGGLTPLHLAAKAGHKRMVELLLKAGANVDAQAGDGQTPLHQAVAAGHRQVVQVLLDAGANLALRTKQGPALVRLPPQNKYVSQATPVGLAVALRNGPLVELLIGASARLDEPVAMMNGANQRSALLLALDIEDFALAGRLLELGASPNFEVDGANPALAAVRARAPVEFLEQLLAQGAQLDVAESEWETLLHLAVDNEDLEGVAWLLDHGLRPDAQIANGNSALLHAVARAAGSSEGLSQAIVERLVESKADPNLANRQGITPLWQAATTRQVELTKRLLSAGGNPNQAHPELGPLSFAVLDTLANSQREVMRQASLPRRFGEVSGPQRPALDFSVLESLLAAGADPNTERNDKRLLHHAVNFGAECVRLVLQYRADPNGRVGEKGATPLEMIARLRSGKGGSMTPTGAEDLAEVERLLRAAGARDVAPDPVEPTIQPTPSTSQTESKSRWVTIFGQVRNPGMLKLPDDQRMDLFEAITAQGGITDKGDPERIQVGRGTNLFRFRLNQLMTNRFELQHEDKIQVREKLF